MSPKLRSLLARITLVAGVALLVSLLSRSAPKDHTLVITLESRQVSRIEGVITREGDTEPTGGFSRDFPVSSPRVVRHDFSAPTGTYIVVITLRDRRERAGTGDDDAGGGQPESPIPNETSFERRVSLAGGELIVSPE